MHITMCTSTSRVRNSVKKEGIAASASVGLTAGSPIVLLNVVENDLYNLRLTPNGLTHRLRQKLHSLGLRGLVPTSVPVDFYERYISSPHIRIRPTFY